MRDRQTHDLPMPTRIDRARLALAMNYPDWTSCWRTSIGTAIR